MANMVIEFLGRMLDMQRYDAGDTQVYRVRGQVFLASAGHLGAVFDYQHVTPRVQIDLRDAHL
ncbi:sulfate transporter [Stenotrophomonas maltophilia]|uniref:sulfate transporter n=1 Tax=Stenotrophomonas maltophilia TaxID=40324 RepID=UPI003BF80F53